MAKRKAQPKPIDAPVFFVHPKVAAMYERCNPLQPDVHMTVPRFQYRGLLSRITPEVAADLATSGGLIRRKG